MPDVDQTVDIDTSGPEVEVDISDTQPETVVEETTVEETTNVENNTSANDTTEKSNESVDVQANDTEKKDKELKDYSEGVKKRIATLTKKMREAERREEAATIYAKSVLAEKESLNSRLTKLDSGFVSEKENRIKSGLEASVAKLAKAREEGDLRAEVAASAEISRLGYEEARLADLKSRQAELKATQQPVYQPQQEIEQPRQVDARARDWARNNDWFNKDPIMTEGAKVIHRQLTETEGYDPNSEPEEYYSEIDRRIRLEFPHKFGSNTDTTTKMPTQTVASATRTSRPSSRKIVKLTSSQVAIARKLGVPLKDYAEQLKITEGV